MMDQSLMGQGPTNPERAGAHRDFPGSPIGQSAPDREFNIFDFPEVDFMENIYLKNLERYLESVSAKMCGCVLARNTQKRHKYSAAKSYSEKT
jgi:hypothetical protein